MKIFISYSHDFSEKVFRIAEDLTTRGYDIWIDRNQITTGSNWRERITNGILECDMVLAFLSSHGLREDGICREELRVACMCNRRNILPILLESNIGDMIPAMIKSIQYLDLSAWDSVAEEEQENFYAEAIESIVSSCNQNAENRKRQLEYLARWLKIDTRLSSDLFDETEEYCDRAWLGCLLGDWEKKRGNNICLLVGYPGFGKTCYSTGYFHESTTTIGVSLCKWEKNSSVDVIQVIKKIAFAIALGVPEFRAGLIWKINNLNLDVEKYSALELFDFLVVDSFSTIIDGNHETFVMIVDGIDEFTTEGRNEMAEVLSKRMHSLPPYFKLFLTTRNDSAVTKVLHEATVIEPSRTQTEVAGDLKEYIKRVFDKLNQAVMPEEADRIADELVKKSEGSFLYIYTVMKGIQSGEFTTEDIPSFFPQISDVYGQWMNRIADSGKYEKEYYDVFSVLSCAERLPLRILKGTLEWSEKRVHTFKNIFGMVLSYSVDCFGEECIGLEKDFKNWLLRENNDAYFTSTEDGQVLLLDYLNECYREEDLDKSKRALFVRLIKEAGKRKWMKELSADSVFLSELYADIEELQQYDVYFKEWTELLESILAMTDRYESESADMFRYLLGEGYLYHCDYHRATECLEKAKQLDVIRKENRLYYLGVLYDWHGMRNASVNAFQELLTIAESEQHISAETKAVAGLIWNDHFNDLSEARLYIERLKAYNLNEDDEIMRQMLLARIEMSAGEVEKAYSIYTAVLEKNVDFIGRYDLVSQKKQMMLMEALVCFYDSKRFAQGVEVGKRIYERLKNTNTLAESYCLSWIALNQLGLGDVEEAECCLERAKSIGDRRDDSEWLTMHFTSVEAYIALHKCDYKESIRLHKIVLDYAEKCSDGWVIGDTCGEILKILAIEKQTDSALVNEMLDRMGGLAEKTALPHLEYKYRILNAVWNKDNLVAQKAALDSSDAGEHLASVDYGEMLYFCYLISSDNAYLEKMKRYANKLRDANSPYEIKATSFMKKIYSEVGLDELCN